MHCALLFLGLIALQLGNSLALNLTAYMRFTNNCQCGVYPESVVTRIVGGHEASPHSHPWQVAILSNNRMHCGGAIINDRHILTAGHCFNWHDTNKMTVILGLHDRIFMEAEHMGAVIASIKTITVHEDFASDFLHDSDDIALVELKERIKFTDKIQPICLPVAGYLNPNGKKVTVAGWGRTKHGGTPARNLQEATLYVMPNEICSGIHQIGDHITNNVMCAYESNVDACQGDSGGPLTWDSRNRIEQIGVVSWGIGCAQIGMPGVYTRVSKYMEWIVAHTRNAVYCRDPALYN